MGELLSKVIPLSLGAAVSPTVLAVILVVLSGRRAIARGSAYLAGVLMVLAGLTALGLYGVRQTDPSPETELVGHVVDGIAGVLLLLLALGTVLRAALRDPAAPAPVTHDSDHRPGITGAFVLGTAMMISNFSTILLYLPAMHTISIAHVNTGDQVLAVALAFVITSLPASLPYLFRIVAPAAAAPMFDRLHAFVAHNQRRIGVAIELLFGAYLLVKALR